MKRKLIFLLGLIGITGIIILASKTILGRSPRQGVLKINSTPASSVFIDNKHKGRTPLEDKIDAGEYTIKIMPDSTVQSSVSWEGKITIAPNLLTYINRDLGESELTSAGEVLWLEKISSKQSEISITTIPDGATVILDDQTKGVTPISIPDISPGDHTVTISSPGFISRNLKIRTTAGYKLNASVQLALSQSAATAAPIQTVTPGATASATPTGTPGKTPTPTKATTSTATSSGVFTTPPKPYVVIKDTPTGFLNVRESPGGSIVGKVNPGEKYSYTDTQSYSGQSWYKIKYDGTNTGWVTGQYVDVVQ